MCLLNLFRWRSDSSFTAWSTVSAFVLSLIGATMFGFAAESSTLTSVRSLLDDPRSQFQVVLRGTVTYNNRQLIVQDQTGAIAIDTPPNTNLNLGDEVEVHGQLEKRAGIPII